MPLSVKAKAVSVLQRQHLWSSVLPGNVHSPCETQQNQVTLQKAEEKQLKTNPQYYVTFYFHVFPSFLGSSEKVGDIQQILTITPEFNIKQRR